MHRNYNLRNRIVNNDVEKPSSIFIKHVTHKMKDEDKKANVEIVKIK